MSNGDWNRHRDLRETCLHELAHAIVSLRWVSTVTVEIYPNSDFSGEGELESTILGHARSCTPSNPAQQAAILWAGPLAEIWDSEPGIDLEAILSLFEGPDGAEMEAGGQSDWDKLKELGPEAWREGSTLAMTILADEWEYLNALAEELCVDYMENGFAQITLTS